MKKLALVIMFLQASWISSAHAGSLSADHPFIGTWRVDIPALSCHEIYRVRANGTTLVTSGEEVVESTFEISDRPSDKGFYKWVDKITKDNGKKDCSGELMQVGHESTNYIIFNSPRSQFLLCEAEDINTCIGPFFRQKDKET